MNSNSFGNASPCSILSSQIKSGRTSKPSRKKSAYFCDQLKVPNHFLPSKTYHGQRTSQPTVRYFVDKFPMFSGNESPAPPVVTFTYIQGTEASLTDFVHHLEAYLPLFRQLSEFRFLYLARADSHFEKAKELFKSLVAVPLESDAAEDILRYFQIRKAWDLKEYAALTEGDLIFRNDANQRFRGDRFEHLYRAWKAARVTEANIRQEFGGNGRHHTVHFAAQVLLRVAAADGDSAKKG